MRSHSTKATGKHSERLREKPLDPIAGIVRAAYRKHARTGIARQALDLCFRENVPEPN